MIEAIRALFGRLFSAPNNTLVQPSSSGLIVLIAIMTFLVCLIASTVHIVRGFADDWRSGVAREITIQLRANSVPDAKAELDRAINAARATRGVSQVRALTEAETKKLLEPWLGSNPDLRAIPVPRLIVVELANDNADIDGLRKNLAAQLPGATVDDHRGWQDRLARAADTASAAGVAILIMALAATVISAIIATRGAVSANRSVVEVLHFVGARDQFIASTFQKHFLEIGLKGAAIGAALASLPFLFARFARSAENPAAGLAADHFHLSVWGYLQLPVLALVIAALIALTSRFTARRLLRNIG